MSTQTEAQRLAERLTARSKKQLLGQLDNDAAAELLRLEAANAELLEALKVCEKTIDRLWVSHHANAADHALDLSRAAIKKHGGAA